MPVGALQCTLFIVQCTKCQEMPIPLLIAGILTNTGGNYERRGYHKRFGNADAPKVPGWLDGHLCRLGDRQEDQRM
jgi:hypothetical protein